jgi:hypothetical protein
MMKVWLSFSSEHSAGVRIIGTFKSIGNAQAAVDAFNALLQHHHDHPGANTEEVCKAHGIYSLTEQDDLELDWLEPIQSTHNVIDVYTDEVDILAIIKVMLSKGGKIQIYRMVDEQ